MALPNLLSASGRKRLKRTLAAGMLSAATLLPAMAIGAPSAYAAPNPPSVSPTSGLDAAGATVNVKGSGYDEGTGVYVRLCGAPTQALGDEAGRNSVGPCDGQGIWVTNAMTVPGTAPMTSGAFDVNLPVAGAFQDKDGGVVDCMTAGACGIYIRGDHTSADNYSLDVFVPLNFDPNSTPPVFEDEDEAEDGAVTLTLSKSTGLAGGETITATGTGYAPDQGIYIQFCAAPENANSGEADGRSTRCFPGQDGKHTVWMTPVAADGTFSSPIVVERSFTLADGTELDCSAPGACGVFTRRDHNGGATDFTQDKFVPVTFGDGDMAPAPQATLRGNRVDRLFVGGDEVRVEGSGFRPGVAYVIAQCVAGDSSACNFAQAKEVTANEVGDLSIVLPVQGRVGSVECGTNKCEIRSWAVSLSEPGDEVTLPISFAVGSNSVLPRTGSNTMPMVATGAAALLAGAAFLGLSRRRETTY